MISAIVSIITAVISAIVTISTTAIEGSEKWRAITLTEYAKSRQSVENTAITFGVVLGIIIILALLIRK